MKSSLFSYLVGTDIKSNIAEDALNKKRPISKFPYVLDKEAQMKNVTRVNKPPNRTKLNDLVKM